MLKDINKLQTKVTSAVWDVVACMTRLLGLDNIASVSKEVDAYWLDYLKLAHKVVSTGNESEELAVLPNDLADMPKMTWD